METFRLQELSDSDHDGLEAVLTTAPPASSSTPDATAVAASVMNVGHQRAALELRNLTLEREVGAKLCAGYFRSDDGKQTAKSTGTTFGHRRGFLYYRI